MQITPGTGSSFRRTSARRLAGTRQLPLSCPVSWLGVTLACLLRLLLAASSSAPALLSAGDRLTALGYVPGFEPPNRHRALWKGAQEIQSASSFEARLFSLQNLIAVNQKGIDVNHYITDSCRTQPFYLLLKLTESHSPSSRLSIRSVYAELSSMPIQLRASALAASRLVPEPA